jgi:hypothetical protein
MIFDLECWVLVQFMGCGDEGEVFDDDGSRQIATIGGATKR